MLACIWNRDSGDDAFLCICGFPFPSDDRFQRKKNGILTNAHISGSEECEKNKNSRRHLLATPMLQ